ncbi:MAG: flagellar filament capping protein FliD [Deltaproteobacteria bacterium]|nr:flagellar filament capping protein FliD [Deltaproteobacteria bacterium]
MADTTLSGIAQALFPQPSITFSGLGSGIDSQGIITKLVEVESRHIQRLESWKSEWTEKIAALQEVNVKLTDLKNAAAAMDTLAEFQVKTVSSSNTAVLTAAAAATAASGSHQVLVNQLAQNEIEVHAGLGAPDAVINASGSSQVFAFSYAGGAAVSINVPDGATLQDLADAINASGANPGVAAMVLDMGAAFTTDRYRLMLQGQNTGSYYSIAVDDGLTTLDGAGGTVNFGSAAFTQSQAAQNAQVRLDGYPPGAWIERAGNQISDLIAGVTLSLHAASASPVTVSVNYDAAAMQAKIADLVAAYNDAVSFIREQTAYNRITGQAGVLFGNYAVNLVKSELTAIATGNAPGFQDPEDAFVNLAQLGITTDVDEASETFGQLLINETTLAAALNSNPEAVGHLLAASFRGVSNDAGGNITYYSSLPGITLPGVYEVAATVSGGVITSGTINGHPAAIDGDTLTGLSGYPEYGLAVRVNLADGSYAGTVRLQLGVNGQFSRKLDDLLSASSGPVNILISNYNDIVGSIDAKIEFEQRRVEGVRQRLMEQFARLEAVLAQLNDQANYLAGQLQNLNTSTRKS